MKSKFLFLPAAVVIFGSGLLTGERLSSKPTNPGQIVGVNHVGIRVPDFDSAAAFYEEVLGFPMTYRFADPAGNLAFAFFQVSESTFIELLPADEEHPPGLDHFGLEVKQLDAVVAYFRDAGVEVTDPYVSPYTRIYLSHAHDFDGVYFELVEALEGSDLEKAMLEWDAPTP